jgi:hypothetical protein
VQPRRRSCFHLRVRLSYQTPTSRSARNSTSKSYIVNKERCEDLENLPGTFIGIRRWRGRKCPMVRD